MDKLYFLTAGIPIKAKASNYASGIDILKELSLDGLELEFVRGVRISDKSKKIISTAISDNSIIATAHAPFFINLNSPEPEKIVNSIKYITDTLDIAQELGVYSITYHAAYYMGSSKEDTYNAVYKANLQIDKYMKDNNIKLWVRPETTGKATQWGDLEEVVRLSKEFEFVLPCVDFSHLHARTVGGLNTYDDFAYMFEFIGKELGSDALQNFHAHIAGIEYTSKGERKHVMLNECDMNYKDLMKAFADFEVKGVVVCESPIMEDDAVLLQQAFSRFVDKE